jgi:hypothetical protein
VPLSFTPSPEQDRIADRTENAHHINGPPRALAFWHLASLDAPTVAIVWSLAFAWAGGVRLPLWIPILLALVTWWVYVADRLLDARAGLRNPAQHMLRDRHRFHWRYRRVLLPMAMAAACAAAGIIVAFMPPMARARDSVLAAAALAYFSGVHSSRITWRLPHRYLRSFSGKEFLVGVLFTAGCVLPAWHRPRALDARDSGIWIFWIPAVFFAALAWLNCGCIAQWEGVEGPAYCDDRSLRSPHSVALALVAIGLMLCLLTAASAHPRPAALLAAGATSALLLGLLDRKRARMTPLALRAAADLVLLTPLALIPVAWLFR